MASSGRRSSRPHLPPEQYCTISSASPPTGKAEGDHQAQHPGAQKVIPAQVDPAPGPEMPESTAITEKINANDQRARPPAVDKGRRAQIGGKRLGVRCCVFREPFVRPYVLTSCGRVAAGRFACRNRNLRVGRIRRSHARRSLARRSADRPAPPSPAASTAAHTRQMPLVRRNIFQIPDLRARRHILRRRRLAQLQRANVGRNRPAILRRQLRRVVGHRAVAMRHHVEVVRKRLRHAAPGRADWPPACSRAAQSRPARCPRASGTACSRC